MIKRTIFTIVLATAAMVVQAQEWFKTDSVTIQGRIEGYDAEQFGFTSMSDTFDDVFEKEGTVLVLDINDDGTFCKKFKVSYPVRLSFSADESKVGFKGMRIFARPGETIDVTVAKDANGKYQCRYNGGSSSEVQRWLRSGWKFSELSRAMWRFKGKLDEKDVQIDRLKKKLNEKDALIERLKFKLDAKDQTLEDAYAAVRGLATVTDALEHTQQVLLIESILADNFLLGRHQPVKEQHDAEADAESGEEGAQEESQDA